MYRTLISGCLQMFARPIGKDYVIARQGGLQNNIWPAEAVCMRRVLEATEAEYSNEGEILLPMHVGRKPSEPQTEGPFVADGVNLIAAGVCAPNSETARKIEMYYKNRCIFWNGLHGLMNCGLLPGHQWDPWTGHVWYTGFVEQMWFDVFLQQGRLKEAEETLEAQLRYSMTAEYCVCERYCDNDPYFVPWLPNGSGNGRIIEMRFDFFDAMSAS